MANEILTHIDGDAPPLDTVLLWLTMTVERDFVERGVFPTLRYTSAKSNRTSSSLHYLTEGQAQAVLADALQRVQQVRKGLKTAYNAHVNALQTAMAEAGERPSIFAAPAAVCLQENGMWDVWRGTKQQLQAQGIQRDGPWPGEPGGKDHRCGATDARGYKTSVKRYSTTWPGLFVATIETPYEVRKREYDRSANDDKAEKIRRDLASMPKSADDFRSNLIADVRRSLRFLLSWHSKVSEYHGFRLAEGTMEQVDEALDGVVEVLGKASVQFDAALHAEVEQRYRAELASADTAFQSKMSDLLKLNSAVLGGGVR